MAFTNPLLLISARDLIIGKYSFSMNTSFIDCTIPSIVVIYTYSFEQQYIAVAVLRGWSGKLLTPNAEMGAFPAPSAFTAELASDFTSGMVGAVFELACGSSKTNFTESVGLKIAASTFVFRTNLKLPLPKSFAPMVTGFVSWHPPQYPKSFSANLNVVLCSDYAHLDKVFVPPKRFIKGSLRAIYNGKGVH